MTYFDLSSSQKMLLFSEINNPHNDSFYLKFRKDYHLNDFDIVITQLAIHVPTKNSSTIEIIITEKFILFLCMIYPLKFNIAIKAKVFV